MQDIETSQLRGIVVRSRIYILFFFLYNLTIIRLPVQPDYMIFCYRITQIDTVQLWYNKIQYNAESHIQHSSDRVLPELRNLLQKAWGSIS